MHSSCVRGPCHGQECESGGVRVRGRHGGHHGPCHDHGRHVGRHGDSLGEEAENENGRGSGPEAKDDDRTARRKTEDSWPTCFCYEYSNWMTHRRTTYLDAQSSSLKGSAVPVGKKCWFGERISSLMGKSAHFVIGILGVALGAKFDESVAAGGRRLSARSLSIFFREKRVTRKSKRIFLRSAEASRMA